MTTPDLTDPQKLLVNANGSMFVEACPGAGKTKAIVARFVRRTEEEPRKGIALVSFTNAAIDEVTDRCGERPQSLNVPHFIGTFDAFINRFIVTPLYTRDYKQAVRFVDSWDAVASSKVRLSGMAGPGLELEWFDFGCDGKATFEEKRVPKRSLYQAKKLIAEKGRALCWQAQRRREDLIKGGVLSSSASRALAAQWLIDPRDRQLVATLLAHRFAEIIVDEAQDCGADELAVLKLLRDAGVALVLVADLDQSIYEFRRSLPEEIRRFANTLPQGQRLDGNFRSSPAICRITASVSGRQQVDHALGPHAGSEVPIHLVPYADLDKVGGQAMEVAGRYGLTASDITFLAYRGQDARQAAGASSQAEVGENKVLRVAAAGRVLADPTAEPRARLRARNDLEQALLFLVGHKVDVSGCDQACAKLGITPAWLTETVVRMALALNSSTVDAADYTTRLRAFLTSLRWPTTQKIGYARLKSPTSAQWQEFLAGSNDSLPWSTIHRAKGRQFSAVGLVIPQSLQQDNTNLNAVDYWEQGNDAESKRVLYVGVSRAEQLLILLVHTDHAERISKILVRDEVSYE